MSELYTVIMRGEHFTLTRDQVEFDSPNYFTSCFLGEFTESQTRTVTHSRNPDLFRIIIDYLNGYKVLPLHESALLKRMGMDAALFNLLVDAQFYLLDGLITQIKTSQQEIVSTPSSRLPSHIIISKLWVRKDQSSNWGAPVPIQADLAQELKELHGEFHQDLLQTWDSVKPELDKSLRNAGFPIPYYFITFWRGRTNSYPIEKWEDCYILKLIT